MHIFAVLEQVSKSDKPGGKPAEDFLKSGAIIGGATGGMLFLIIIVIVVSRIFLRNRQEEDVRVMLP